MDVVSKSDPELNSFGVQMLNGDILFSTQNRKYNDALKFYSEASEIDPYSVDAMLKMG